MATTPTTAYATPAQFVQAYGLGETLQLLGDEQGLLKRPTLQWALAMLDDATLTWAHAPAPELPADPLTDERLMQHAWLVFNGTKTWSDYSGTVPSVAEQAVLAQRVADAAAAADAALLRLQTALRKATQEIVGYLRSAMRLPLEAAVIADAGLDECCWVLARCRLADDADNYSERIGECCKEKRAWLMAVAKGQVTLGAAQDAVHSTGRIVTGYSRSRYFGDEDATWLR